MKRTISILTALVMFFTTAAFASPSESSQLVAPDGTTVEVGASVSESAVQPRARVLFSETLNGQQSYIVVIPCTPSYGTTMRFTIVNTGTAAINVSLYQNGEYLADYSVPAGESRYAEASKPGGVDATYTFYLNSASLDSGMYCTLEAVQS